MRAWSKLLDRPVSKCLLLACVLLLATGGKDCGYTEKEPDPKTIKYYANASPASVDLSPGSPSAVITLSGNCDPKPRENPCNDPSSWSVGKKTLGSYATIVTPGGGSGFQTAQIIVDDWKAVAELVTSVDGTLTKEVSFEPQNPPYPVTGNRTVIVRLHPPQPGGERTEEPAKKPRLTVIPLPSLTPERSYQTGVQYTGPDTTMNLTVSGDTLYIHTPPIKDRALTDGTFVPVEIDVGGGVSGKTYRLTLTFTTKTSPAATATLSVESIYPNQP